MIERRKKWIRSLHQNRKDEGSKYRQQNCNHGYRVQRETTGVEWAESIQGGL